MCRTEWIRKFALKWKHIVNEDNIAIKYFAYYPEQILKTYDYRLLNDVINIYTLKTCPLTLDEQIYADIVLSAAYCRRRELRLISKCRRLDFDVDFDL